MPLVGEAVPSRRSAPGGAGKPGREDDFLDVIVGGDHVDSGQDPDETIVGLALSPNIAIFAIVALFILVWVAALAYWRFGRVEARWAIPIRDGHLVSETLEE